MNRMNSYADRRGGIGLRRSGCLVVFYVGLASLALVGVSCSELSAALEDDGRPFWEERVTAGDPGQMTGIWELDEIRTNTTERIGEGAVGDVVLLLDPNGDETSIATLWQTCHSNDGRAGQTRVSAVSEVEIEIDNAQLAMVDESGEEIEPASSDGQLTFLSHAFNTADSCNSTLSAETWAFDVYGHMATLDNGETTTVWRKVGATSDIQPYHRNPISKTGGPR